MKSKNKIIFLFCILFLLSGCLVSQQPDTTQQDITEIKTGIQNLQSQMNTIKSQMLTSKDIRDLLNTTIQVTKSRINSTAENQDIPGCLTEEEYRMWRDIWKEGYISNTKFDKITAQYNTCKIENVG